VEDKLLRLCEVEARVGFKRNWIYRKIKSGEFPAQIHVGTSSRWRESEILEWISQQSSAAA
jgi:prophage regulatory protein